ncbi:MAG: hypothetical protein KY455_14180, partial [Euryarchaeota archaeon]|nr:hypothetical protein [Euryarchaeota archaeon]
CPQPDAGLISRAMMDMLPSPGDLISQCENVAQDNEWLCHPHPETGFEHGPCIEQCITQSVALADQGPDIQIPDSWLVFCQAYVNAITFPVVLVVFESPACPAPFSETPNEPIPLTSQEDLIEIEGDPVTLTTGICQYHIVGKAHGFGVDHTNDYPCTYKE